VELFQQFVKLFARKSREALESKNSVTDIDVQRQNSPPDEIDADFAEDVAARGDGANAPIRDKSFLRHG
jgi:hypothetical protein